MKTTKKTSNEKLTSGVSNKLLTSMFQLERMVNSSSIALNLFVGAMSISESIYPKFEMQFLIYTHISYMC